MRCSDLRPYADSSLISQVASRDAAFVFDLLALHTSKALDDCLTQLMSSRSILKLGCALSGDWQKLAASYPDMQAFHGAQHLLELKQAWQCWLQQQPNRQVRGVFPLAPQPAACTMEHGSFRKSQPRN